MYRADHRSDLADVPPTPLSAAPTPSVAAKESLSLESLMSLKAIDDIMSQLRLLNHEETMIDAELDQILRNQPVVEKKLDSLEALRPQITMLEVDAENLFNVILRTSELAETISGKVRQLDLEQSRVKEAISILQDVQDLRDCASGVQQAMNVNDYEAAGRHIRRFLEFDQVSMAQIFDHEVAALYNSEGLGSGEIAIYDSTDILAEAAQSLEMPLSSPTRQDNPLKILRHARRTLTDQVVEELDSAVRRADEDGIVRFIKIFPLLGQHALGLDKHSAYICGILSRSCQDGMKSINERASAPYADLLTRLFEFVASLVDAQEVLIETHFGPGRLLRIIQRLQRETDIQSSIILSTFADRKQIQRRLSEVSAYEAATSNGRVVSGKSELQQVDPREADAIVNELALISQRTNLFQRFLTVRANDQLAKLGPSIDTSKIPELDGVQLNPKSNLSERVRELMSYYVMFEEYFIRRSMEKAMKIDEHEPGSLTSSSVDDVFYIMKKSVGRALSTGDSITVCALLGVVGRLLETDFVAVFQKKLSNSFSTVEAKDAKMGFMVLLNNIDVSCDYVQRLVKEINHDVDIQYGPTSSNEVISNIRTSLRSLLDYASSFKKILMTWVENMFNQTVKPRVRPLFQDCYKDVRYVLTEDEYAEQDAADLFLKRFVASIGKIIAVYQKTFTERNYNQTVAHCIDAIVKEWERYLVQSQKFNQLGALRFDKDTRGVTSYLTSLTPWSLRDKFARLVQIAVILNLEKLSEIHEVWGMKAGGLQWRLTANDVRRYLVLRVDFKPDDVAKLKL